MKYKVGDTVRIKHHVEDKCSNSCVFFNSSMKLLIGKTSQIKEVYFNKYNLKDFQWNWSDCMLEAVFDSESIIKKTKLKELKEDEVTCKTCYEIVPESESTINPEIEVMCASCFSNQCTICNNCEDPLWLDDARGFQEGLYCSDCLWEIAFECGDCNTLCPRTEEFICEDCESHYCEDCYNEDDCRQEETQDQDLEFQDGKKSTLITIPRYVGVEIEAECGNRKEINLPSSFGVKSDGSLDETGVEVVTPPSKASALVDNVKLACKELHRTGFKPTDACGLHVHIDLRDVRTDFIKLSRILRTFFAIEDVIFAMLPKSRLSNSYCNPLRNNYNFYDFYGSKVAKEFDCKVYAEKNKRLVQSFKRDHYHSKRYTAFNFHSTFFRGTLEIRAHSASQNPAKILKWIELLLKVVDWSINNYKHSQVEELLKLNATENKVHKMKKIFKFSDKIEDYINSRIKQFKHEGLRIPFKLGRIPKRRKTQRGGK